MKVGPTTSGANFNGDPLELGETQLKQRLGKFYRANEPLLPILAFLSTPCMAISNSTAIQRKLADRRMSSFFRVPLLPFAILRPLLCNPLIDAQRLTLIDRTFFRVVDVKVQRAGNGDEGFLKDSALWNAVYPSPAVSMKITEVLIESPASSHYENN